MVRANNNNNNTQETSLENVAPGLEGPKDMFRIGRRSAVNTSELGLYSDHGDYYNTSIYGAAVRKFVIGIMVVISVILIGIFLYDFASSASVSSKVNQETKHIYILQNSLRKPGNGSLRRSGVTLAPTIYIVNSSQPSILEERIDADDDLVFEDMAPMKSENDRSQPMVIEKLRAANLQSSQVSDRNSERLHREASRNQNQGTIDNHAMIYRVRSKLRYPDDDKAQSNGEYNQRATQFHYEMKGPPPASFKRQKYPQLTQYRYSHTSRNIQDIIKYLTSESNTLKRGVKFTGYYVGTKKYDVDTGHVNTARIATRDNPTKEQKSLAHKSDPFYKYKPKHPSDVNLLATSNFRFSPPTDMYAYKPYYNPHNHINQEQPIYGETQHDNEGLHGVNNYVKNQKPKPFSVMLDIYPITDAMEQTKNYASKGKHSRFQGMPRQSSYPMSIKNQQQQQRVPQEDEKHQMILHLNLYPKKKITTTRNSAIERSERFPANDDSKQPKENIMIPSDIITKRLTDNVAIEKAKLYENEDVVEPLELRNEETFPQEPQRATRVQKSKANVANATVLVPHTASSKKLANSPFKNINTVDGFQGFADSLIAMD